MSHIKDQSACNWLRGAVLCCAVQVAVCRNFTPIKLLLAGSMGVTGMISFAYHFSQVLRLSFFAYSMSCPRLTSHMAVPVCFRNRFSGHALVLLSGELLPTSRLRNAHF